MRAKKGNSSASEATKKKKRRKNGKKIAHIVKGGGDIVSSYGLPLFALQHWEFLCEVNSTRFVVSSIRSAFRLPRFCCFFCYGFWIQLNSLIITNVEPYFH